MLGGSLFRYLSEIKSLDILGTVRSKSASEELRLQGFNNFETESTPAALRSLRQTILNFKPEFVLNCVGVIKQSEASKRITNLIKINSLFPHLLAEVCDEVGAQLIHFSTDCVFSGSVGMYKETDLPDAIDGYGRSKLLGEISYRPHLTLRTSIIGHELNKSLSLVDWFLKQNGSVRGFKNAIFSGLPTVCVADFLNNYVFWEKLIRSLSLKCKTNR